MATGLQISNYSSLYFERPDIDNPLPSQGWRMGFQSPALYIQRFIPSDPIKIQYTLQNNTSIPDWVLVNETTGERVTVDPSLVFTASTYKIYELTFSYLPVGSYVLYLMNTNLNRVFLYSPFCIVESFPYSVLLRCAHDRSEFGTYFQGSDFNIRVEGSFLPSEVTQAIEANFYRDQFYALDQLAALPYETQTLTIGGKYGVPNWMARKLNLYFSTIEVTVNDKVYIRGESAVPEIDAFSSDYPLFIYKIALEPKESVYLEDVTLVDHYLLAAEDRRLIVVGSGNNIFIDMNYYG